MTMQELFSAPDSWCQYQKARDAEGTSVRFDSPAATQFCLLGALSRCYPAHDSRKHDNIYFRIYYILNGPVSEWNDAPNRTIEDIRELVKNLNI